MALLALVLVLSVLLVLRDYHHLKPENSSKVWPRLKVTAYLWLSLLLGVYLATQEGMSFPKVVAILVAYVLLMVIIPRFFYINLG